MKIVALLGLCLLGSQQSPDWAGKEISVNIRKAPFEEAVKQLFEKAGEKYRILPGGPTLRVMMPYAKGRFRILLRDLMLITNRTYDRINGEYVIRPLRKLGADWEDGFDLKTRLFGRVEYHDSDVQLVVTELLAQAGKAHSWDPKVEGTVTISKNNIKLDDILTLVLRQVDGAYRVTEKGYEIYRVRTDGARSLLR